MHTTEILSIQHPQAVFAVLATLAAFVLYYFVGHSRVIRDYVSRKYDDTQFRIRWVLFQKFWGFFSMGILPVVAFVVLFGKAPPEYGFNFSSLFRFWPWLVLTLIVPTAANYFLARLPSNLEQYPQMRISDWTPGRFFANVLGWVFYLLAYEYLFRGLLLFTFYDAFGLWMAVSVNIALYSLAHLSKGAGETLGAIPFGILLCLVTLYTGTILFSLLLHLALALSNDFLSIRFNPDMSFKRNTKQK